MKPSKPYIVGLTGGIACGKSHLSQALREHGAVVVDADLLSHALTAKGGAALPKILERFGDGVFDGDDLNRKALADLVFHDEKALADLNAIIHPLVFAQINQEIDRHAGEDILVIDIPLLHETGYDKHCGQVWCAYVPLEIQMQRLMKRGMSQEDAKARLENQLPALEKAQRSDQVIMTSGEKADSARAVQRLYDQLKEQIENARR